jgi:hypothetical protein
MNEPDHGATMATAQRARDGRRRRATREGKKQNAAAVDFDDDRVGSACASVTCAAADGT